MYIRASSKFSYDPVIHGYRSIVTRYRRSNGLSTCSSSFAVGRQMVARVRLSTADPTRKRSQCAATSRSAARHGAVRSVCARSGSSAADRRRGEERLRDQVRVPRRDDGAARGESLLRHRGGDDGAPAAARQRRVRELLHRVRDAEGDDQS